MGLWCQMPDVVGDLRVGLSLASSFTPGLLTVLEQPKRPPKYDGRTVIGQKPLRAAICSLRERCGHVRHGEACEACDRLLSLSGPSRSLHGAGPIIWQGRCLVIGGSKIN
jgi:hypothetical protein